MSVRKDEVKQKRHLLLDTEMFVTMRIECCVCGVRHEDEYDSEEDAENKFPSVVYELGWRYGSSNEAGVEGIMCAECYDNRDNKSYLENVNAF